MHMVKKGEWLEIEVPNEWNGQTIETLLKQILKTPKKLLHQMRMDKRVQINGQSATQWNVAIHQGDRLRIRLFIEESYGVLPEYMPLSIVYEDDHLLIANKIAGIDTHPNEGEGGTLANAVAFHLQSEGVATKIRHIHRLDKDTSGGVVFAKHALSGAVLDQMLERREITRTYYAFVHGIVRQKKGTITAKIGRDRHHPTRRRVSNTGDGAITHYEIVEVFPKHKVTLLKLKLDTGRTHQIRVHLSHLGHPIVADDLYGGKLIGSLRRQALHAGHISFTHPFTNETISVKIPWPNDLQEFEKYIRFHIK